jgi:sensor histidine kinase YesM
VKLTAFEAEGEYWFVIEDNGVGIGSGGSSTKSGSDKRQGVGLLNINKRLKYEYGRELHMESEPGRGTKVTVRIPAESA